MKHTINLLLPVLAIVLWTSCSAPQNKDVVTQKKVRLITLDPGHFHAALVQKKMYPDIDSLVYVYAPGGTDLDEHLKRIEGYNTRLDAPTRWAETVYTGADYLAKMIAEK